MMASGEVAQWVMRHPKATVAEVMAEFDLSYEQFTAIVRSIREREDRGLTMPFNRGKRTREERDKAIRDTKKPPLGRIELHDKDGAEGYAAYYPFMDGERKEVDYKPITDRTQFDPSLDDEPEVASTVYDWPMRFGNENDAASALWQRYEKDSEWQALVPQGE